jgi:hypothetical protein
VKLQLKYFQVSTRQKRLVEANLYFDDLCTTQKPKQFGGSANILDMMNERGIFPCDVDVNGNIKSQYNTTHWLGLILLMTLSLVDLCTWSSSHLWD